MRHVIAALCLLLFTALPALAGNMPPGPSLPKEKIVVTTADGKNHGLTVELARTDEQKIRGLMFRNSMPADEGMLFINEVSQPLSFWMKNTLIPLDMLFIGPDGRILNVHHNAKPLDLTPVPSEGPAKAALEINGGVAKKLGIHEGDTVHASIFGNTVVE